MHTYNSYKPLRRRFTASNLDLEAWMLAVILTAHPAQEIPFADLLRLPERFAVQRQGISWDMVRLV